MLRRFRRALLISAMGRNLAVDLVASHGAAAPAELHAMLAMENADPDHREILLKAGHELRKLGFE